MSNPTQEITPDQLLESFRGRSLKSVLLFTVVIHVVIICGTSVPYIIKSITGGSDSKLGEKERTEIAAREATEAIRDIATKHGLKPQDLSTRIAGGAAPKAPVTEEAETPAPTEEPPAPENAPTGQPEKPKSAIEKELEVKEEGPKVPAIPTEEATDEDLFK